MYLSDYLSVYICMRVLLPHSPLPESARAGLWHLDVFATDSASLLRHCAVVAMVCVWMEKREKARDREWDKKMDREREKERGDAMLHSLLLANGECHQAFCSLLQHAGNLWNCLQTVLEFRSAYVMEIMGVLYPSDVICIIVHLLHI